MQRVPGAQYITAVTVQFGKCAAAFAPVENGGVCLKPERLSDATGKCVCIRMDRRRTVGTVSVLKTFSMGVLLYL